MTSLLPTFLFAIQLRIVDLFLFYSIHGSPSNSILVNYLYWSSQSILFSRSHSHLHDYLSSRHMPIYTSGCPFTFYVLQSLTTRTTQTENFSASLGLPVCAPPIHLSHGIITSLIIFDSIYSPVHKGYIILFLPPSSCVVTRTSHRYSIVHPLPSPFMTTLTQATSSTMQPRLHT
jgi:hypothetical protein